MTGAAGPESDLAVEARGLAKHFGVARALSGLDLSLPRGTFLTLFGPNGAGKTTLVKVLATLARPSGGFLRLFGQDPGRAGAALRRRIGVVSHQSFLYGDLSGLENVEFAARMFDVPQPRRRAQEYLERVGLAGRMHDAVDAYSRGMEQRCAIARALVHEPDLLLLDEPFTGLDPDAAERLSEILRRTHDGRRTVLLTSHDLMRGPELADRVAVLVRGRVTVERPCRGMDPVELAALYRAMTRDGGRRG